MLASHELDSYPPETSSSHATSSLLDERPPPSRRHQRPAQLRRYWKPLAIIGVPFLLVLLYSAIHPHVDGLPPLPAIHVGDRPIAAQGEHPCACGSGAGEGARVCDVYGETNLISSRLYEGSGARVRRMLAKAREGKSVKIGILGGSVSACHGLHPNIEYPQGDPGGPGCYSSLLKEWITNAFPGPQHEVFNGAIGGMDSSYYAFCGTHHIASDVDLIILEFDVNDQATIDYQEYFDQLMRVLLEFPSQPAVLILGAWSPQVAQDQGYADPQVVHLPIAHYYDIPYVSMKRMLYNTYLRWPHQTAEAFWQHDFLHPNARGHRVLADLAISYLESQLCQLNLYGVPKMLSATKTIATTEDFDNLVEIPFPLAPPHMTDPAKPPPGWEATFDLEPLHKLPTESRSFLQPNTPFSVPLVGLFQPLREVVDPLAKDPSTAKHITSLVQPKMFCVDANDHEHPMKPTVSEGWKPFVWNGEKNFWVSDTVGARIRVEIEVHAGRVAVYFFRSQKYDLGDARCWVDDNEKGAVSLAGWWDKTYNVATVEYIDEKVTPGDHYVTCEVSKNTSHPSNPNAHHFRIVAVMAT